jgi:hypothetical protein
VSLCAHGIFSAHNTLDLLTKGFHGRGLATSWNALSTSAVADTTTTWNTRVLDAKACARSTNRLHADGHTGKWSPEEETRLNSIMQEMHESGKRPDTTPKFWKEVSRRMDNTRAAKQCSNKWYEYFRRLANVYSPYRRNESLSPTVKSLGRTPRWREADSRILVQK